MKVQRRGVANRVTPREEVALFTAMNAVVAHCYAEVQYNSVMRSLVQWYLLGAEKVKTKSLTDEEWAAWIVVGNSNAYGNSFGEVHKADPMIVLASLPPMAKFRPFLLSKYEALSKNPKFGAVKYKWDCYVKSQKK